MKWLLALPDPPDPGVVADRGRQVSVRDGAGIRQLAAILARLVPLLPPTPRQPPPVRFDRQLGSLIPPTVSRTPYGRQVCSLDPDPHTSDPMPTTEISLRDDGGEERHLSLPARSQHDGNRQEYS
ncbi:unnamed protein product [Arctogadus glacialis]